VAILGIDYGSKRIGIALSNSGIIASPHSTLRNSGPFESAVDPIVALGISLDVDVYVVGIPRSLRHDAARTEERFQRVAELIRQKSGKEVVLWDEALTSVEAESALRERGRSRSEIRQEVDVEAACIILQSWLDEHGRRAS
jgi:putative Holliday junction resolvase